jgi:hypothetical protein
MKKTIKKLFDWTASDTQAWEKIRQRGFWHFIIRYGMLGFGLFLFILSGVATVLSWRQAPNGLSGLLFQLTFVAGVCLSGGLITGLLTWWLEDSIYRKIMKSRL